jgi:Raf kinase inhibitor-like YbhB/YbcL family protein
MRIRGVGLYTGTNAALLCALAVAAAGCGGDDKPGKALPAAKAPLSLRSPAFDEGGTIPTRYTCSGQGWSPPLTWAPAPPRTRELALVVEDPDAGRFVHWTVLHIPKGTGAVRENQVPPTAIQTKNSLGKKGWTPPCPPKGDSPHHYVFALYANDAPLGLGADASADDVRSALADHAIARGTLTGRFGR